MSRALLLVPIVVASAAVLAGCGYSGEPKPPSLKRPMKVSNLAAVERGARIIVTFELPQETTEGLPITGTPDIELRIGAVPVPWNQQAWQANSDRIPVPAWPAAPAPSGGSSRRLLKGLPKAPPTSGGSGRPAAQRRAAKATASASAASTKALFARTIQIDAAKYSGKATVIGVRVLGPTGRDDGWATIPLEVFPVLPVPRDLRAVDMPGAVHLQWAAEAPAFRVYRRLRAPNGAPEAEWVQLADSTQPSYDDTTFEYGKTWQYYVQSVRQTGGNTLESDPSDIYTFTPADKFPPAVPAGLGGIAGTRSIELFWDRVADADLAGYRIYRNGTRIADGVQTPAYSDANVVAGTKYSYQLSAVDQSGNESMRSPAFEITME